jgi:S-adenosylmethionine hydrolase
VNGHYVGVLARTFGEVPSDQPFVYVGSMGKIAIGVAKGRRIRPSKQTPDHL